MTDVDQGWFWRMQRGETPPPVAMLLGQSIARVDVDAGELQADYLAAATFANPAGHVQGGMLAAMLDALTASVVDATLRPGERVATLNLNVAFLRPALPGPLQGRASLTRRGRSVANAHAQLLQHGKPVASATAVCMVVPETPD
jgi:uncharacterized protein (TIGR00369 family)